jgi:aminoglycoside 3-N-acetyltransferase
VDSLGDGRCLHLRTRSTTRMGSSRWLIEGCLRRPIRRRTVGASASEPYTSSYSYTYLSCSSVLASLCTSPTESAGAAFSLTWWPLRISSNSLVPLVPPVRCLNPPALEYHRRGGATSCDHSPLKWGQHSVSDPLSHQPTELSSMKAQSATVPSPSHSRGDARHHPPVNSIPDTTDGLVADGARQVPGVRRSAGVSAGGGAPRRRWLGKTRRIPLNEEERVAESADGLVTRAAVAAGVRALGVGSGDVLYLRAGLRDLGELDGSPRDVFLGGLLDVIGSTGTLMVPAFVRPYWIWQRDIPVSDENTPPTVGALSKMVLELEGALRSSHPTHSFAAIGPQAPYLLEGHGQDSGCHEPVRRVVELDGKMLLVGCLRESPGFSTVHLVQFDLGLSQRHYSKLLTHARLPGDDGRYYRLLESPGCSVGFDKLYRDYANDGNLVAGYVGSARSLCVGAARAYATEHAILSKTPRYCLCDNPACLSCRILRGYNKRAVPIAAARLVARKLKSALVDRRRAQARRGPRERSSPPRRSSGTVLTR